LSIAHPARPDTGTAHNDAARKTIAEEIAALERLRDGLDESFDQAVDTLLECRGKVVTLGVGKSGHAAQKVAATLRSVGLPALYMNASDSLHGDLGVLCEGDVMMLFSKSGTTSELLVLIPHLRAHGTILMAVVGSPNSPLARQSDIVLDASVEREGCPLDAAPMASVLTAQAVGDALASAITCARGFTSDDFARLHPAGALGARLSLTVGDVMRRGNELPVVHEEVTLREAVIEITRAGYGAVCVIDDDQKLKGFITDGDIRRQLLEVDRLSKVPVTDVMSRNPLSLTPELPLSQALLMLEQRKKAFLTAPVVVDDGRCVGLLRLHDTVQAHLPGIPPNGS
jgi:arabinose-5-phosphate isomerase